MREPWEDLIRLDRKRKSKTLSNEEWVSRTDPEARIARMKDGTTHLAYKPEHAIDLDTGAVVAAEMHPADEGDTTTLTGTLDAAQRNLTNVGAPPSSDEPAECVATRAITRAVLKDLDGGLGQRGLPNRSVGASRAGTGTRTRAGRFTTTALGCAQVWANRRCANGRKWSSAPLRTSWTGVVCAGHGCGAGERP